MPAKTVIVGSAIGLHARPAAIIAEAVVNAGVPVTLSLDGGEPVDAGSALMIMTLGAGNGAQVTVASDDEAALDDRRGAGPARPRRLTRADLLPKSRQRVERLRTADPPTTASSTSPAEVTAIACARYLASDGANAPIDCRPRRISSGRSRRQARMSVVAT